MAPKFTLQNVLDIRHSRVEALEIELGKAVANQRMVEEKMVSLRGMKTSLMKQLEGAQQGDLNLVDLQLIRQDLLLAEYSLETAADELEEARKAVTRRRYELVEAKKEEETLQTLKQKYVEEQRSELVRVETRNQDDLYIAHAFRNRAQGA